MLLFALIVEYIPWPQQKCHSFTSGRYFINYARFTAAATTATKTIPGEVQLLLSLLVCESGVWKRFPKQEKRYKKFECKYEEKMKLRIREKNFYDGLFFSPFTLCSFPFTLPTFKSSIYLIGFQWNNFHWNHFRRNHFTIRKIKNATERKFGFEPNSTNNTNLIMHKCFKLILEQQSAQVNFELTLPQLFVLYFFISDLGNSTRRIEYFEWYISRGSIEKSIQHFQSFKRKALDL